MSITDNLLQIRQEIPSNVKLIAVSKFQSIDAIQEAYSAGQRVFGESRMQELEQKQMHLPQDIEWHFIGHLQTNKVKSIVQYVDTIHSVDSWKLLSEIEKQASAINRRIKCLLEIHIAEETSKYGFSFDECEKFLTENDWTNNNYAYIGGVMGMATNTRNENQIRIEFGKLKYFQENLKRKYFNYTTDFTAISMGMSHDYKIAIEEGATMVRIGSSIFGNGF